MKRGLKIALSAIVWVAIVAYLIWSGNLGERKRAEAYVHGVEIKIKDSSEISIIRTSDVERWIKSAGLYPVDKHIDSVPLAKISDAVASHDFVKMVRTSVGLNGTVYITVSQRKPIMRVITDNGYDFYYTEDGYIVPAGRHSAHYVPVVTGRFPMPFPTSFSGPLGGDKDDKEKNSDINYIFIYKLINFVRYIEDNEFWNAQIVQINVLPRSAGQSEPEIELIPRVGNQVILLGSLDGYERRLDKLMTFYRKVAPAEGWDRWSYINLKYDGQVVCRKR